MKKFAIIKYKGWLARSNGQETFATYERVYDYNIIGDIITSKEADELICAHKMALVRDAPDGKVWEMQGNPIKERYWRGNLHTIK